ATQSYGTTAGGACHGRRAASESTQIVDLGGRFHSVTWSERYDVHLQAVPASGTDASSQQSGRRRTCPAWQPRSPFPSSLPNPRGLRSFPAGHLEDFMTFKPKLSARLALMRDRCVTVFTAVIALAAVHACRQPLTPAQPGSRIAISPRTLSLQQNQTSDFTAVGFTSTGDTATVAVSWSVSSGI